jgi:hypothetical protein
MEIRKMGSVVNLINKNEHDEILDKIIELYWDLFCHNGYGSININMKFTKKDQKEIIVAYGKDYRFLAFYPEELKEN